MADFAVILAAAGKSSRFRDKHYKKPFAPLANKAVWLHSAEKFLARKDVRQVLIAVAEDDLQWFQEKFAANLMILGVDVIRGGRTRAETVSRALAHVTESVDFIAVHDAARPCLAEVWIDELFSAAVEHGAVIPAIPVTETLKRVDKDHRVLETVSREGLWRAQTPQVFRADWLKEAHAQAGDSEATDDAALVEALGHAVHVVSGSPLNIKITTRADLTLAAAMLKILPKPKLDGPAHPFDDMWR